MVLVDGSRYSFQEEAELKLISDDMRYDESQKCWVAFFSYFHLRETLKGSREVAN